MSARAVLSESEERKRKAKMTSRLSFLFIILDLALLGVIIYEMLQLF